MLSIQLYSDKNFKYARKKCPFFRTILEYIHRKSFRADNLDTW